MKNIKETKEMKIFDPFCGSGTFLIETLLSAIDYPLRKNNIYDLDFWNWQFL